MGFLSNLFSRNNHATKMSGKASKQTGSEFRGVQINPNSDTCCQAVRDRLGQRFLSNQVPMLPLPGCDSADCRCTYQLFDDRRTDIRRTADVAFDVAGQFLKDDQRSESSSGRRRED